MRLLLISDWAHTGFGRVGRELGAGLSEHGWDIRVIGINWRGIANEFAALARRAGGDRAALQSAVDALRDEPLLERIMPASEYGDQMGNNLTAPAVRGDLWSGWVPDRVLVVADPRAMYARLATDQGALARVPTFNYVPIEGGGLPPAYGAVWDVARPIAMSEFGRDELARLLGRDVALIAHGVSSVFRPLAPNDAGTWKGRAVVSADAAKEAIGLAGRTIILRTDRYILRKNYPAFFRIIRPTLALHPEVVAVVHTVTADDVGWGDIRELMSREPGAVRHGDGFYDWHHPQIILTGAHDSWRGLDDDELRTLYAAADLYVSPTMAEGFGLCLAESLACGVPVTATDYSSVREVVGPGGTLIPPASLFTNPYSHEWALVDEAAMSAAVERLITKPALRAAMGESGRRHVAGFTWPAAVDAFDRLLQTGSAAVAA